MANKLGIAKYVLYTSPSLCLSLMAYVPTLQEQGRLPVGTDPFNDIPGMAPIVATDMPTMMLNYKIIPEVYDFFLRNCARLPEAKGVLINSFEELEHKCIEGIRDRIYGASSPQVSFNLVFSRILFLLLLFCMFQGFWHCEGGFQLHILDPRGCIVIRSFNVRWLCFSYKHIWSQWNWRNQNSYRSLIHLPRGGSAICK